MQIAGEIVSRNRETKNKYTRPTKAMQKDSRYFDNVE